MRKFKLVKAYPGFEEIGTEVIFNESDFSQVETLKSKYRTMSLKEIAKWGDFWEEFTETYEILSFHIPMTNSIVDKKQNGLFSYGKHEGVYSVDQLLSQNKNSSSLNEEDSCKYVIHSVKRLVDGQVFTIGDTVVRHEDDYCKSPNLTPRVITSFEIKTRGLKTNDIVFKVNKRNAPYILSCFSHIKLPMFTTEDGYEIFNENDLVWDVSTKNWDYLGQTEAQFFVGCLKNLKDRKAFYKKKNAKEFVLFNRPMLSVTDLVNYLKTQDIEIDIVHPEFIKFVKNL